jgi:hypothetical protein
VSAGLHDPFAGLLLLITSQIVVLENDLHLYPLGRSDYPFDVPDEQVPLAVLEGRDVHDHVDLLGTKVEDLLGLILLH